MKSFSIREAIRFGWHATRQHSGVLFQAMLTLFALDIAGQIIERVLQGTWLGALASLALMIADIILSAGFTVIALRLAEGHTARYRDILPPFAAVWPFFAASFVAAVATVLGLVLLVIPGIYITLRLSMARFAVIDHWAANGKAGIMESLRHSWQSTRGHAWRLLGFFIVVVAINLVGFLALGVGLLVSVPVTTLAWAHVYIKLKHRA